MVRNIHLSKFPPQAVEIISTLQNGGYLAYFVGGCIRDLIAGREPKDWDIATAAQPSQVGELFSHIIPTGEKHGTVTVVYQESFFEVTTFRTDGAYSDGRRPDSVEFTASIEEDLARRDFTMNAIAYDPIADTFVDPYNGYDDIMYNKTIKAVGNPIERFREDGLRMMRAIRFSCQLGFPIDNRTLLAVVQCNEIIQLISKERIRDELIKILLSNKPAEGIGTLYMAGLLDHFIPELSRCAGFNQQNPHHDKDVFDHIMAVLDATPPVLKVRLAALFHDIGKPDTFELHNVDGKMRGRFYGHDRLGAEMTVEIMNRLKFPSSLTYDVMRLVDYHMSRVPKLRPKNIKRLINRVGEQNIRDLIYLMKADVIGHKPPHDFTDLDNMVTEVEACLNAKEPMSLKDMALNGNDLIAAGFKPGPTIGNLLKICYEVILDEPLKNQKQYLLGYAMAQTVPMEELNHEDC